MLKSPCAASSTPFNTGVDCSVKMGAPALIIMMQADYKWQASDEANFLSFLQARIHDPYATRFYPLFGNAKPIRTITEGKETDVTVTYDDGSMGFIRNGMFMRTFLTNKGGLRFSQALLSINAFSNWAFIEVDKLGKVNRKINDDGSRQGFPLNVAYGGTPDLATFKTEYQSTFSLNFDPAIYISRGFISVSDEYLLDVDGLIDLSIVNGTAVSNNIAPSTATTTVTAIGSNGDTQDYRVNGVSISGGAVTKTSAETTATLFAAKVATAVTAAASTNGGITATYAGAIVTYSNAGSALNGITITFVNVGGITSTATAFTGGTTTTTGLQFGVQTLGKGTDMVVKYPALASATVVQFVDAAGNVVTPSAVTVSGSNIVATGTFLPRTTYTVSGTGAAALKALMVSGFEITKSFTLTTP